MHERGRCLQIVDDVRELRSIIQGLRRPSFVDLSLNYVFDCSNEEHHLLCAIIARKIISHRI